MKKKERKCTSCKKIKLLDEFYNVVSRPQGKDYRCKECSKLYMAKYFGTQYHTQRYKKIHRKRQHDYALKNPEKMKAHAIAQKLPNKNICDKCGTGSTIHKHHPDYSKPDYVLYLCISCHERTHHA